MGYDIKIKKDWIIINLGEKLDGSNAEEIQNNAIKNLEKRKYLIFNMKECNYISSAGLRTMLYIAKYLAMREGETLIAEISEEVRDIMEMTGFDHMFKMYDSLNDAENIINN